jgi:tRNA (guanosine-2'-O-)-methyltransferase
MLSTSRLKKFQQVSRDRQSGLVLVLEDIHDPHNAAAILRTCDGLGIQDVYVIFEHEAFYNIKKIGKVSSSSANKWLTFHIFRSAKECFKELKKKGYIITITILDKDADNLFTANLTDKKLALVVGNEHRGVSPEAIKLSDRKLYLPMQGFVQSFNVSVTAALFLYEIVRQRIATGNKQRLPAKEATKLLADFKKR